ncbi:MAG TPA: hypothetical protein VKP04_03840, partial [Ktedonobacteraceae bacterium]|nr:hypothetical protein [Ktedonobacteraceae bacterium]
MNCGAGRGYSKATFQFSAARKRAFSVKRCGGVCALAAHKLHHTFLQERINDATPIFVDTCGAQTP